MVLSINTPSSERFMDGSNTNLPIKWVNINSPFAAKFPMIEICWSELSKKCGFLKYFAWL